VSTVDFYKQLGIDRALVSRFFIVFSRLEYALKRTGSTKYARGDENWVEANWTAFASEVDSRFRPEKTAALSQAVEYIEHHPPLKQVLASHRLDFKPVVEDTGVRLNNLLLAVRRARNNLFHGGKFPDPTGPIKDPGHDKDLL